MAKPKVPKQADNKDQSERFIETTRKMEADDTGKALDEAFKKTVPTAKPKEGWRMLTLPTGYGTYDIATGAQSISGNFPEACHACAVCRSVSISW